ncbi:helix-turn-helix domain-containing protein, partial [Streptococcus pneumoniae]|uniref:helix-turn-helix domain-containing protein n=1 Tax=Streptococcus pneumoniae TaxID=1313 RepID=UPI0034DD306A
SSDVRRLVMDEFALHKGHRYATVIMDAERTRVQRVDWLEPASRLTQRLRIWLESLLRLLPISHVSRLSGLHWHTLKTLDKRRLEAEVGTFNSSDVRRLVMDEFALHKGHRYATVIMDAERTRV